MIEPLTKTIRVPCSQKQAFDTFLALQSWWPMGKFTTSAIGGGSVKSLTLDPRVGGQIVETGSDGREWLWGTILSYDPHAALSMDFHVPHPEHVMPGRTRVDLRFTPLSATETEVTLVQSDFEALGPMGESVRGGYGMGWTMIFEQAYAAACAA